MTKLPTFRPKSRDKVDVNEDRVQISYLYLEGKDARDFRKACKAYGLSYHKMVQQMVKFALEQLEKDHEDR